jgi:hypothetical protein
MKQRVPTIRSHVSDHETVVTNLNMKDQHNEQS